MKRFFIVSNHSRKEIKLLKEKFKSKLTLNCCYKNKTYLKLFKTQVN